MVFTGVAVNFMLRVQLNLVIVAVVRAPEKAAVVSECTAILNNTNFWNNNTRLDYKEEQHLYTDNQRVK